MLLAAFAAPALAELVRAVNGLIDLRSVKLDDDTLLSALTASGISTGISCWAPEIFIAKLRSNFLLAVRVPPFGTTRALSGESLPGFGYGTYRLVVYAPKVDEPLALRRAPDGPSPVGN